MVNVENLDSRFCDLVHNDVRQAGDNQLTSSGDLPLTSPQGKEIERAGRIECGPCDRPAAAGLSWRMYLVIP